MQQQASRCALKFVPTPVTPQVAPQLAVPQVVPQPVHSGQLPVMQQRLPPQQTQYSYMPAEEPDSCTDIREDLGTE